MSGIVGIWHRNGKRLNPNYLKSFADFLVFRGPDKASLWSDGPVGFGHALLQTTWGSPSANEFLTGSDERFRIAADARLDGRAELRSKLESAGCAAKECENDAQLILQAYASWGAGCLTYLRGDFAFAIWDTREKALFCARDHFGIKPFYFVAHRDFFLFSNTLNCVRLHPQIGNDLNNRAIADFLLFGLNCDASTTTFRDIQRLPPAHSMLVSAAKIEIQRYWSVPVDGRVRYARVQDYVENFRHVFQLAIDDRVQADRVAILLSGGLDSSAVAAMARHSFPQSNRRPELFAFTNTYQTLLPDQDGSYARRTASFLDIPIKCLPLDGLKIFERWSDQGINWPEPVDDPLGAGLFDLFHAMAADSRVVLSGEGSDNLMYFQMLPHLRQLVRNNDFYPALADWVHYVSIRPLPWRGLRRLAEGLVGVNRLIPRFPEWIKPCLARHYQLKERWKNCNRLPVPIEAHPSLPKAHASLSLPQWLRLFELGDSGVTRHPVEVRYPFLDLRVVEYLLAIPPFPWAFNKNILRRAMSGYLPEIVRLKRKTPATGDPILKRLQMPESSWINRVPWCDEIDRYILRSSIPMPTKAKSSVDVSLSLRPLCLNFWLQSRSRVGYKLSAEA